MAVTSSVVVVTAGLTYGISQMNASDWQEASDDTPIVSGVRNSFTDAVEPCKRKLAKDSGAKIISLRIDTRSSYYHPDTRLFKIFLYSDLESPSLFGGRSNYQLQVVCWVRESNLTLADYRTYRRVGDEWPEDQ